MSAHTPAPWVAERKGDHWTVMADRRITPDLGYRWTVAAYNGDPKHGDAMEANARLIAAAPELLASLKEVNEALGEPRIADVWPTTPDWYPRVLAAIAKAEGK